MLFRIFKMIATSGFLTALECTKFVFGRVRGSLQRSPRPPSWFKGDILLRGREGRGRRGEGGREEGRGGDAPPFANSWIRPWGQSFSSKVMQDHLFKINIYRDLTSSSRYPFRLTCNITACVQNIRHHARILSCTQLINGCVIDALFDAVPSV